MKFARHRRIAHRERESRASIRLIVIEISVTALACGLVMAILLVIL